MISSKLSLLMHFSNKKSLNNLSTKENNEMKKLNFVKQNLISQINNCTFKYAYF